MRPAASAGRGWLRRRMSAVASADRVRLRRHVSAVASAGVRHARRRARTVALATASLVVLAAPALAYVAPGATVVSASLERRELADDATSAVALSGDGRHVVLATSARNLFPDDVADPPGQHFQGGIFRRDVAGGGVELVALGDLVTEAGTLVRTGAANPSISRDGRFVAFSTGERLVPADVNENVDVYVRDMAVPRGPAAYRLVSARDGSEEPARYGGEGGPGAPGADVTPGMAISGDGNRVVFRTIERTSDLPSAAAPDVAPYQVYVRDLAARSTRLLTVSRGDGSPAGGALSGAAISRDGSTVVWTGLNAAPQTRMLDGRVQRPERVHLPVAPGGRRRDPPDHRRRRCRRPRVLGPVHPQRDRRGARATAR